MGTALAVDAAWLFAAFLIVAVLAAFLIAARRVLLDRGGGTVDCGLRRPGGAWRLGVAAYRPEELRWYHAFGILLSPAEVLDRATLSIVSRRLASPAEAASFGEDTLVIECRGGDGGGTVELAMSEATLTGFLAWLEAAPPGFYRGVTSLSARAAPGPRAAAAPPAVPAVPLDLPAHGGDALSGRRPASRARRRRARSPAGPG